MPTTTLETPAELIAKATGDDLEIRLECLGACTFQEIHARGSWNEMAATVADAWHLPIANPPLASRYDRSHFFVRQWVAQESTSALRTDWTPAALQERMKKLDDRTISFVFGLDPNEGDLEGRPRNFTG